MMMMMTMTEMTRHEQKPEAKRKRDTGTPGKHEQGNCKKHQPDSIGRKQEATMMTTTSTAKADTQRKEEQNKSKKRSRSQPMEKSNKKTKNMNQRRYK